MKILLKEHYSVKIYKEKQDLDKDEHSLSLDSFALLEKYQPRKIFNNTSPFLFEKKENCYHLQANYYVGVDWLIEGKKPVRVEPKINQKHIENFEKNVDSEEKVSINEDDNIKEINFVKMLLDVYTSPIQTQYTTDLVNIFWNEKPIPIKQKNDTLTPFLVVQFLGILKNIVRKGLKKSYYKVRENLNNRVKGKILVGTHIKQNVLKNRFTKTFCEYQVFGEDNFENQFLKKVFQFCSHYIENFKGFPNKTEVNQIIGYCRPAFELISTDIEQSELKNIKHNPFFKEYKEAIQIGNLILKRFSYNISTATQYEQMEIPPFWIDMPKLFELYVYKKLLENKDLHSKIHYQFGTHGNQLDFLISDGENSLIIDTKYKLKYDYGHIHEDIRQVSGYARLKKVREKIGFSEDNDTHIDCLIIYPTIKNGNIEINFEKKEKIKLYHKVFKLDIKLPTNESNEL
ncbi:5-methylcytosine restriction system specificity protein McrC [Capnocytophaga canis]|uniref:5-methylcytosine restriction system specificity protein McrC n=1 Tax=Capnocytophaga canis TaxID=1848903 RepID=UPI0015627733|nr:restriction endonuclease [Capnocytophaga canis]